VARAVPNRRKPCRSDERALSGGVQAFSLGRISAAKLAREAAACSTRFSSTIAPPDRPLQAQGVKADARRQLAIHYRAHRQPHLRKLAVDQLR
jgi:hypothetical protein